MPLRIEKLAAKNFEGIETADLAISPTFTMLYGPNGSGKSSLADAILFALTGAPLRGGVLSDLVRQGARSASVEVVANGMSVIRHRTKSGGEVFIDGVSEPVAVADGKIRARLGADPRTITAALRAGALLELTPDKLQALLTTLTGAAVDEAAITEALGDAVVAAAQRAGLELPRTIEQFAARQAEAESLRKQAKRDVNARLADIERLLPGVPGDQLGDRSAIEARLTDLRMRREKAVRGGGERAGRAEQLRARLEELEAITKPASDGAGLTAAVEARDNARVALATAEGDVVRLEQSLQVAQENATGDAAEDEHRVAGKDGIAERLAAATKAEATAATDLRRITVRGTALTASLARLPVAGCVGACPVLPDTECPLKDLGELKGKLEAALESERALAREAQARQKAAKADVAAAQSELRAVEAAAARIDARSKLANIETALAEVKRDVATRTEQARELAAEAKRLGDETARWNRWTGAEQERARIAEQLAAVPEQTEDPAVVDAEIAVAQSELDGIEQATRRATAEGALRTAEQLVADTDTVAKAVGPTGAKAALLAKAISPFVEAANLALTRLAPGYAVEVTDALEIVVRKGDLSLRPGQLSDGERTRFLYVLQYAVARLSGVSLLVFDRAELLDDAGKVALKKLIGACASEGIQVVMLSCAAPPERVQAGIAAYLVTGGRVAKIAAV